MITVFIDDKECSAREGSTIIDAARENAYRLVFLRHGIKDSSFQTDYELINALTGLHCPEFRLLSLETVFFTDLDNWQVVDTLWKDFPEG